MIELKNGKQSISLVQIGAGGTGGWLVPNIARIIRTIKEAPQDRYSQRNIHYLVADGDRVEQIMSGGQVLKSNLHRQNFIPPDLDKFKAEVQAKRYSMGLGVNIKSSTNFIENGTDVGKLFENLAEYSNLEILLSCVDNHKARLAMHDYFCNCSQHKELIYIDAGNGRYDGQVVCGYKVRGQEILPAPGTVFPDLLKPNEQEKSTFNCAQTVWKDPQTMIANVFSATSILGMVYSILVDQKIESKLCFFDAEKLTMRSIEAQEGSINNQKCA